MPPKSAKMALRERSMGPVNWLAVLIAALAALAVSSVWYGPLYGRARLEELGPGGLGHRAAPWRTLALTFALLLLSSSMIGHMFARVGAATLAAKPWLYFMMTGGLAGAFVIPAMGINYRNLRISLRLALIDAGFWLVAYLSIGLTFFVAGLADWVGGGSAAKKARAAMIISVSYDSSAANAPAGFKAAVAAAVQFWESRITSAITVNITFGYGTVDGQPLDPGAVGESVEQGLTLPYDQVLKGLATNATSSSDFTSLNALLAGDPTGGTPFFVTTAEAKALGLYPATESGIDGYVGLSAKDPFTYTGGTIAAGTYDAVGALEHEISEVLGRISGLGQGTDPASMFYTPIDLFRYVAAGVRGLTPASGYFSIDGTALLAQFNNPANGGDAADLANAGNDAFSAFGAPGAAATIAPVDLQMMDVLGYRLDSAAPPAAPVIAVPGVAPTAFTTYNATTTLAAGQTYYVNTAPAMLGTMSNTTLYAISLGPLPAGAPVPAITLTNNAAVVAITGTTAAIGIVAQNDGDSFVNGSTGSVTVETSGSNGAYGVQDSSNTAVTNLGAITVVSNNDWATAVSGNFVRTQTAAVFTNAAGATVTAWAASGAIGVLWSGQGVSNSGTITVSSTGGQGFGATGVTSAASFTNTATGMIAVRSTVSATGVAGSDAPRQTPYDFHNAGLISVIGSLAIGVNEADLFDNSGTIIARNTVPGTGSIGVQLDQIRNVTDTYAFTNSGTISADVAIYDLSYLDRTITNSGHIFGDLYFNYVQASRNVTVNNTGTIVGDVIFGSGTDTYNGATGTLFGSIYLGSGSNALVITDFGAAGSQNTLSIYGYAGAQTVAQQGADTLITLSASDSILLKGVQAATLTSRNVVYGTGSFNVPLTPSPRTSTALNLSADYTVAAGAILKLRELPVGVIEDVDAATKPISFTNQGMVDIASTASVTGITISSSAAPASMVNAAGAVFRVNSLNDGAVGYDSYIDPADVTNAGQMSIEGLFSATGIRSGGTGVVLNNATTGVISVIADAGDATGIYSLNYDGGAASPFTNHGQILVTGYTAATGVQIDNFDNAATLTNDGTITVVAQAPGVQSVGLKLDGLTTAATAAGSNIRTVANSGTITADIAIEIFDAGDSPPQFPSLNIVNSGTLNGALVLTRATQQIHNTGTINGAIDLGDSTGTIVSSGTITGPITLRNGSDSIDLHAGYYTGTISIAATTGETDTILTGTGNAVIHITGGNSALAATITGGADGYTGIDFDVAYGAATITHNGDGSWTVAAGTDGTETLHNVQALHFTDRTVVLGGVQLTAAQVLAAGAGLAKAYANPDGSPGWITVVDTAANLTGAVLDALQGYATLGQIVVTDSAMVAATPAQMVADAGVIGKVVFANGRRTGTIVTRDTAANLAAAYGDLTANPLIGEALVTDNKPIVLTVAQITAHPGMFLLPLMRINGLLAHLVVADTAKALSSKLKFLGAHTKIVQIVVTDNTAVFANVAQLTTYGPALAKLAFANGQASGTIRVGDTAANLAAAFGALGANAAVGRINVSDNLPVLLTVAQFQADGAAIAKLKFNVDGSAATVTVADSAAHVLGALSALTAASKLGAIALTDAGPVTLAITYAQYTANLAALGRISGTFTLTVSGAPAGVIGGGTTAGPLDGSAGHLVVIAAAGGTVLTGGAGDTLWGGAGADTFAFHAGFGAETIDNFTTTGASHDTLQFDKGLFADWAHLLGATKQQGSDLLITLDASDTLLVRNVSLAHFTSSNAVFA
eukprot:gene12840-12940_t